MQYLPYFQTTRYRVQAMVELANIQPEDNHVDLGSGDGRILIAFAEKGILSHGFELDKPLVQLSEINITAAKISGKAFVQQKDFWQEDLSVFSIVTVYPMPDILAALETKLQMELQPGSRILVNYYPLPTWKPAAVKDHIYLYHKA